MSDLGLDHRRVGEYEEVADVPEEDFEKFVAEGRAGRLSSAGIRKKARKAWVKKERVTRTKKRIDAATGPRFEVIRVDSEPVIATLGAASFDPSERTLRAREKICLYAPSSP